ncbi:TlyA family RNA methyltransferase [Kiritimatiellota bacterium B12222]|nr:TlyA family RNA methyltransferase [Kiritimatiellota bacterium B12222]
MAKIRLDVLVHRRELTDSREQAQRLIRAGKIRVNGQVASKPGFSVQDDVELELEQPPRFVSRGGDKLMGAIAEWPDLPLDGVIAIDIGSSTGGFTDCMLQHGAQKVYAVDVGRGQLHWNMRQDDRVDVREETNARYLEAADFSPRPSFCVIDTSFISLKLILPAADRVLLPGAQVISLIKPQFEAGAKNLRKGVVVDKEIRQHVVEDIRIYGTEKLGWTWCGVARSPLKGPKGNVEFLARWKLPEA